MLTIVGTGRSGSGYMAQLLNKCGVKCGHEQVYTPYKVKSKKGWQADSSWVSLPHLKSPSVLIIRDPLKVVKSRMELGIFLTSSEWGGFIKKFSPMVYTFDTPQDKALAHWVYWNMYAMSKVDLVIRLEDMNLENLNKILKLGGFKTVNKFPDLGLVNKKTNYKNRVWNGDWSSFDPKLSKLAQEQAKQWGY